MFGKSIITPLKTELLKRPYVVGFVLAGSYVRKDVYKATEYSDMEAYIIVDDKDVTRIEKDLTAIVKKSGKVIFHYKNRWSGFSVVFENLFRLELPVVKRSDIKSVFSRPTAQPVEILIDKTNGALKTALDKRPKDLDFESIFQDIILDFWYMAIVAVQYFKKSEIWNARHVQEVVLVPLIIKLFELRDERNHLLLESNKRIEEFLGEDRLAILKNISSLYESDQIQNSLLLVMEEFSKAARDVSIKYGFSYRKDVEEKIKPRLKKLLNNSSE